jgi:hypothetical protein
MSKKDLANVTADLSALASMLPTQRPKARAKTAPPEPVSQFSLSLRRDLRKQLARLADDADMTMRAFVLNALKAKGLAVRDDDLLDLRKERAGADFR